jgi:D-alanine-D-alanine ligase
VKVAIVYNRESNDVINLFGAPNRERIGLQTIERVRRALKAGGHQVTTLEGDKNLIRKLEDFMPRVVSGERPGMVFNVSYGIQGQARYTHVPSILEMVGIPYVASGPLAHSLALDKVVAKMMFRQEGLPTPDFTVLQNPDSEIPDLLYPLIVKPKNEAVSFGLTIAHNEQEVREAAQVIFDKFEQPVLVEQYIEGREVNVGLIGNNPPEALPPAMLDFGSDGPPIYTYADKTGHSQRKVRVVCPAPLPPGLLDQARKLALSAFAALGCYDCARVDMRLDADDNLHILEVNSLPSLGEHGSYLAAAETAGMDFDALINRVVEEASARYFGTPTPPRVATQPATVNEQIFDFITSRRDRIEKRLREWVNISSRTSDPVGMAEAVRELGRRLADMGLKRVDRFTDERSVWAWETSAGLQGGTLLVGHLDVPVQLDVPRQTFRREGEWLHGEGIGSSRASLVMLEFALRALRSQRRLQRQKVGILYYQDEGRDCRYSGTLIRAAAASASRVLVLRPGNPGDKVVTQRRGQRRYSFTVEGKPRRPGRAAQRPNVVRRVTAKLEEMAQLSSSKDRISVSVTELRTQAFPMLLPHRVQGTLLVTYADA